MVDVTGVTYSETIEWLTGDHPMLDESFEQIFKEQEEGQEEEEM